MKQVIMYKAIDGRLFDTEEACVKHDNFCIAYDKIDEIYSKYSKTDKRYSCVYTQLPDFIKEVMQCFGLELKKSTITGIDTFYSLEPNTEIASKEVLEAWNTWHTRHILPW